MNMAARIKSNGKINIGIVAFRNIDNVYTPERAELIYDKNTQRNYPNGITEEDRENDLDGKSKGIARTVAEVETKTKWLIEDSSTYFTPTIYNLSHPEGYTIAIPGHTNFWITNFNTNQDSAGYNSGVESDILPLAFEDNIKKWLFDTRHYTPMNGNGILTETPPVNSAIIMGNYGVITRYQIDITNSTNLDKIVTYQLGTKSHAIIRYKLDSQNDNWQTIVKCNTIYDNYNTMNDIFSVSIPRYSSDRLVFEVLLPNADKGGFRNSLKAE